VAHDVMNPPVLVISSPSTPRFLIERTVQKLLQARVNLRSIFHLSDSEHCQEITVDTTRGVILIRAGCWPVSSEPFSGPPASATGRPVIAFGAVRSSQESLPGKGLKSDARKSASESDSSNAWIHWNKLLEISGGDFQANHCRQQLSDWNYVCWIDSRLAMCFIDQLKYESYSSVWQQLLLQQDTRLIHWQSMDVYHDENLRVVQVITSLQRGGAERIAIDLHSWWLRSECITPLLLAVHAPTRSPFPTPPATLKLSQIYDRTERWRCCGRIVSRFTADVVHTHLLTRDEHQVLRKAGGRMMATIHNARSGWQNGTEQFEEQDLDLLVACSQAVEKDLLAAGIRVPTRTIWNGIKLNEFQTDPEFRHECRNRLLESFALPENAILVAALANPRPQKRLERLPAILRLAEQQLHSNGDSRPIHLLIAGEASQGNQLAEHSLQQIHDQVAMWSFESRIHWLGCVEKTRDLLAGIDILVSPSDFEGLSLSHLEALCCGTRVVANDVGGTSEIGARCDGIHLIAAQSEDEEFATKLTEAIGKLSSPPETTQAALLRDFSSIRMRDGYERHYKRIANRSDQHYVEINEGSGRLIQRKPAGVLLVTNNFSTGGAQSSARRLLMELKARGHVVRAAVLQEDLENPTLGRQVLNRHSIEVMCLPRAGSIDPLVALERLFDSTDKMPPECILLWNVIPEYKLLIADSLSSVRLFDVSPGEMNLQSLEKYFLNPRPGLPYRELHEYGKRLTGAVVKYSGERTRVERSFGVPVAVIPNGVVIPEQSANLEPKEKLVIGTAARISPQKRLEDLIEAFRLVQKKLPECELQIAGGVEQGSENYYDCLRRQSSGLPVQWLGEQEDVGPFLQQLDLFAMISEPAGCPNASLEAMAVGLPIVATDFGGANAQVIDQWNGLLVPNRDPEAFGQAMVKLASSLTLRKKYGWASRQRAIELFSIERMAIDYLRLMQLEPCLPVNDA
jgi:glycosyltransferase involved in cell wall biosynthesis